MALSEGDSGAPVAGGGHTRWTRARLGLQVGLMVLLAVIAVGLVIQLGDRGALRGRWDLSADGSNSLDDATLELLDALPGEVEATLFYRSPQPPLQRAFDEALARTRELLTIAEQQAPDNFRVADVDLGDIEATEALLEELGLDRTRLFFKTRYADVLGALVLRSGERHTVLRLVPDLGSLGYPAFDPARPLQPVRLDSWRGEEALAEALGRVSSERTPRVLFSQGACEFDPDTPDATNFGVVRFARALRDEGFGTGTWEFERDGPVPADCSVLVVAAPVEPLSEGTLTAIEDYLQAGGRMLCAMGKAFEDPQADGLAGLLRPYGIFYRRGIVCQPLIDSRGAPIDGVKEVALLTLDGQSAMSSSHPATRPLWERDRSVRLQYARSFERRGISATGGVLLEVLRTPEGCWLDLPNADGAPDFRFEPGRETSGAFHLALSAEFPSAPGSVNAAGKVIACATGSLLADAFHDYNRDLLLNLVNYLADRDFRVRVAARDPFRSVLDLERSSAGSRVGLIVAGLAPGLSVLAGLLLFWRRRRG